MQHPPAAAWFEILGLTVMGIIVIYVLVLLVTVPRKPRKQKRYPCADIERKLGNTVKDGKVVYLDEHESKIS